ncbi:MAG: hypothetical protein ACPGVO_15750 [Spirulinaceae cyanobacterium]
MAKNDFFLEPDDAKTLGDIDYMRKANKVRRTFPGNKTNGGRFEIVKEVNAMEERKMSDSPRAAQPTTSTSSFNNSSASNSAPKTEVRRPSKGDTGMDMFRKMAKGMKR